MTKPSVVIIGSGAGASVVAWALAEAGHPVMLFEKGRNLWNGLGDKKGLGPSLFGNDEIKASRYFENPDPLLEPRTARSRQQAAQGTTRSYVGDVNGLPTTVGGGTIHWDAKTPRFWKQDFKGRSMYGPYPGANVADWPLTYEDLAPLYDVVEARLGVQGDLAAMPANTLAQSPRSKPFPLPPNPPMYGGKLLAEGARSLGYSAYPFPQAVNSVPFDGRPACNSCGFCSGWGCPIHARGGAAVSFLHHALIAGAQLRSRCFVYRIDMDRNGKRATGVSYVDANGARHHQDADIVVVAASAIESARLALLSNLPDRSGQLGRNLMFHYFTVAGALFTEDVHAWMGPSTTFTIDDFVGPVRNPALAAAGLPYLKGGICEAGGTIGAPPLAEAGIYSSVPNGWGAPLKELMRLAAFRKYVTGMSMVGEDLPQLDNRVDLDPDVKDVYGFPVPRVTYTAHRHEVVASEFFGPKMAAVALASPGAIGGAWIPAATLADLTGGSSSALAGVASTAHVMGTARMGSDPATSVVDPYGRLHAVSNVVFADGAVFTSSGGFNPTLTIMALALRAARAIIGDSASTTPPPGVLAVTGDADQAARAALAAAAVLGAVGTRRWRSAEADGTGSPAPHRQ
jgi:choline dehydrogenase-like flavoprotein